MHEERTKLVKRFASVNMDLYDSLICRGVELNKEIGPHACQMLLRDFSNAFSKTSNRVICDVGGNLGRRSY